MSGGMTENTLNSTIPEGMHVNFMNNLKETKIERLYNDVLALDSVKTWLLCNTPSDIKGVDFIEQMHNLLCIVQK